MKKRVDENIVILERYKTIIDLVQQLSISKSI